MSYPKLAPRSMGLRLLSCILHTQSAASVALVATLSMFFSLASAQPNIPSLERTARSGWIDVTDPAYGAIPNDGGNDTAALQAALDNFDINAHTPKVIYLPAGTYHIHQTLQWPRSVGCNLIGDGRDTKIIWNGDPNSIMLWTDGASRARLDGITWDANDTNTIAVNHRSETIIVVPGGNNIGPLLEASTSHYNSAFLRASVGIQGDSAARASSEMFIENCLFENCGTGIDMSKKVNYYNQLIVRCEFRDNDYGVKFGAGYGYVRFCHFENTKYYDIQGAQRVTARYCTSVNAGAFYDAEVGKAKTPGVIQNCVISGWGYIEEDLVFPQAIQVNQNSLIFDNVFENPPDVNEAPIYFARGEAIVSENVSVDTIGPIYEVDPNEVALTEVPEGILRTELWYSPRLPLNVTDSFLVTEREEPTVIFDAVEDFGAIPGDGVDDTVAVQATIDAAAAHGDGAIAYFPAGRYSLAVTVNITGADYVVGGDGYHSDFEWIGPVGTEVDPNVMFAIDKPRNIHVEHLGFHELQLKDYCIAIQQTGYGDTSITYTGLFLPQNPKTTNADARKREGLHIQDLSAQGSVYFGRVNGRVRIEGSAQATVVGEFLNGNHTLIDGADFYANQAGFISGFTGWGSMNGYDLVVDDNLSLVVGDLNFEQSSGSGVEGLRSIRLEKGDETNLTRRRVTVGATKGNLFDSAESFEINDYEGQFSILHGTPYPEINPKYPDDHPFYQKTRELIELYHEGASPIDVFIGATDTTRTSLPILVDADPSLTLTTLANHHERPLPNEWYAADGSGPVWVTSARALEANGQDFALEFDGVDDFLLGSTNFELGKTNDALTAMAWVRPSVLPSTLGRDAHLMGYLRVIESSTFYSWYLRLNSDDTLEFIVKDNNGNPPHSSGKSITLASVGTWMHVAGVWDGNTIKLYINGVEESSLSVVFADLNSNVGDARFVIGGSRQGPPGNQTSFSYAGALDEVRVYNQALSAGDIDDHANLGVNGAGTFGAVDEDGLIAGWHFNEGVNPNSFDYNDDGGGFHLLHYEIYANNNPMDDPMDPNDYDALDIAIVALDHFRELGDNLQDFSKGWPVRPTALTATAVSHDQVDLSWVDESSNEQWFFIESKAGMNNTWTKIGWVPANDEVASDLDLSADTEYFYRIRAVNYAGESFPSNEVSVTTPAAPPPPKITWWNLSMWANGNWDHTTLHWNPAPGLPGPVDFNDGDEVHFDENEIEVNLVGVLRPSKIVSTGYGNNKWFFTGDGVIADTLTGPPTSIEISNGFRKINALGSHTHGDHTFTGGVLIHSGGELLLDTQGMYFFGNGPITLDDGTFSAGPDALFMNRFIIESGGGSLTFNSSTNGFYHYAGMMEMYGDLTLSTHEWDRILLHSYLNLHDDVTITGGNTNINCIFDTQLSGVVTGPHVLTINVTGLGMAIKRSNTPWSINGLTKTGPGILQVDAVNAFGNTLRIESGSVELLEDQTVSDLYLGGIPQAAGTYGSSSSSATNQNDTYFSGSGIVTVQ